MGVQSHFAHDMCPAPAAAPARLLDQVRERLRYGHYSLSTERSYVYWVRWFVRFHGLRHPRDMGAPDVEAFLAWLANRRSASVSTHKQALAALVFLYKQVLGVDLPWLQEIGRPRSPQRLPVVLSRGEVQQLLAATTGEHQLVFRLLYGTGMRKMECLRLRVKDLDFDRCTIQELLGHSHVDTTMIYTHVLNRGTGVLSPLDEVVPVSRMRVPAPAPGARLGAG